MADIELVIKIPEEEYHNYLKMRPSYPEGVFCYIKAIQQGTPPPKGHGDLKDISNLLTVTDIREDGSEFTYVSYSEIDDAPTIIEKDGD